MVEGVKVRNCLDRSEGDLISASTVAVKAADLLGIPPKSFPVGAGEAVQVGKALKRE